MAEVVLRVRQGGFQKELRFGRRDLVIGSDPACDLVLPLRGIDARHARLVVDAGLTRVRALGRTPLFVAGRTVAGDWHVLADGETLDLPVTGEPAVSIGVRTRSVVPGGTMVAEDPSAPEPAAVALPVAPALATAEGVVRSAAPLFGPKPVAPAARPAAARRRWTQERVAMLFGGLLLAMVGLGTTAALFRQHLQHRAAERLAVTVRAADGKIEQALSQITAGQYAAAKLSLDEARVAAESVGQGDAFAPRIGRVADRPEIRFGANGYTLLDGQWLPAATAAAEQAMRDRDRPALDKLKADADAAVASGDLENGRRYADDALEMLARHPVQPPPGATAFAELRQRVQTRLVAADMLARGMVLRDGQWITPQEKFRLDQQAAGLAEYRGRWMPKDEAFVAEQKDKGLTLRDGKWMTADEVRLADGFVRFEDRWVLKAERDAVLADRADKARVAEAQRQIERQRLLDQAKGLDPAADRLERLKGDAYTASQGFLKQRLRVPDKATFRPFNDADVVVAVSDDTFLVRAPVEAPDRQNRMVRKTYVCKLRQGPDGKWVAVSTEIVDD